MAAPGLAIRADVASAPELRRLAKKEPRRRTAQRMLALAMRLRAWAGPMRRERPGLSGRPCVMPSCASTPRGFRAWWTALMAVGLSEAEQAVLVNRILRGPDPERGEPSSWTLPDLCRFIEERFGKSMCPQSMSRVVRRLGLSRQKARPVHPQRDARAAEAFAKGGSPAR